MAVKESVDKSIAKLVLKNAELFCLEINRLLRSAGLTYEQARLLFIISNESGLAQNSLARGAYKDEANTARILKRLTEKGLAEQRRGELDKRRKLVYITEAGKRALSHIAPLMEKAEQKLNSAFTLEEQTLFKKLLLRLGENIPLFGL